MADQGYYKGEKKKSKKNTKEKNVSVSNSPQYQMPEIVSGKKSSES